MFSPTIRSYMKDMFIHVKNVGKVTGEIVSLTEFGFTKVQKIKSLEDMASFIERVCKNKLRHFTSTSQRGSSGNPFSMVQVALLEVIQFLPEGSN